MNEYGAILVVVLVFFAIFGLGMWTGQAALADKIVNNLCPSGGKVEGSVVYCKTDGGYEEVVW